MFKDPLLASSILALTCTAVAGVAAIIWFKYGKKKANLKDKTLAAIKADETEAALNKAFEQTDDVAETVEDSTGETTNVEGAKKEYVSPSLEEVAKSECERPDYAESECDVPTPAEPVEDMTESVSAAELASDAEDSKEEE